MTSQGSSSSFGKRKYKKTEDNSKPRRFEEVKSLNVKIIEAERWPIELEELRDVVQTALDKNGNVDQLQEHQQNFVDAYGRIAELELELEDLKRTFDNAQREIEDGRSGALENEMQSKEQDNHDERTLQRCVVCARAGYSLRNQDEYNTLVLSKVQHEVLEMSAMDREREALLWMRLCGCQFCCGFLDQVARDQEEGCRPITRSKSLDHIKAVHSIDIEEEEKIPQFLRRSRTQSMLRGSLGSYQMWLRAGAKAEKEKRAKAARRIEEIKEANEAEAERRARTSEKGNKLSKEEKSEREARRRSYLEFRKARAARAANAARQNEEQSQDAEPPVDDSDEAIEAALAKHRSSCCTCCRRRSEKAKQA